MFSSPQHTRKHSFTPLPSPVRMNHFKIILPLRQVATVTSEDGVAVNGAGLDAVLWTTVNLEKRGQSLFTIPDKVNALPH